MTWQYRSNRAVPGNWGRRKQTVKRRDHGICHVCQHDGADQVDHIISVSEWTRRQLPGSPHELTNLAMIHGERCQTCGQRCHKDKTAAEAAAAIQSAWRRPAERHPGLI